MGKLTATVSDACKKVVCCVKVMCCTKYNSVLPEDPFQGNLLCACSQPKKKSEAAWYAQKICNLPEVSQGDPSPLHAVCG